MLAMSKMSNPALRMSVLAAAAVTLLVILFTFFQEPLKAPLDYAHQKAQQYCDQSFKYAPASETLHSNTNFELKR